MKFSTLILLCASALAAALPCSASSRQKQSDNGGISAQMLERIQSAYTETASDKAIRNALNAAPVAALSANAENLAMIDTEFSDRVETVGITNQKSSGRCWLFSGLNVLRAEAIKEHGLGDFQFSQNYLFFYDQFEKSNLFLQAVIDTRDKDFSDREVDWLFSNPLSDGGTWTGAANLVHKYGVVPADAMPETYSANNTSGWTSILRKVLRQDGLKLREGRESASRLQKMKEEMLSEVYHILCLTLGTPPTEFTFKGETYTPKSFAAKYVKANLDGGYVLLMNDPSRPYYKTYEIAYDRHLYDGDNWLYLNLPIEDIKPMAIASIKAGKAMYFSCDVGKFLNRTTGVADLNNFDYESLFGVELTMDKSQRVLTHDSGSSHAMTLIAVNVLPDGSTDKWMVENSWGPTSGYKGNIIMTDEWFNEYMFRLVVEKQFVPEKLQKYLNGKPIQLPAWDPMFLDD